MARKPDQWMPLHIGKYLADTAHLTREQHGAYLLLLMAYWSRGGPLPADDARLAATAKATMAEWRKLRPVLAEFFKEHDGAWHQKRADEELSKAGHIVEQRANAGRASAAAKAQQRANEKSTHVDGLLGLPLNSRTKGGADLNLVPSTKNKEEETKSISAVPALRHISKNLLNGHEREFDQFWGAYPKRVGKGKAVKAYLKALLKTDAESILAATKRYAGIRKGEDPTYTAHPTSWLNGECWTDDFTLNAQSSEPDPNLAAALAAEAEHRRKHGEIE